MEVILKQPVDRLGGPLDLVKVKDGFARNYLIPRGLAVLATEGNKKAIKKGIQMKEARDERELKEARGLARKMETKSLTIPVKVGEEDKLFGSVTSQMIADCLAAEGFSIDRKMIELEEPIKELGVYTVPVRLAKDIAAKIKVWVVKESEE
jgi:large subunit ribosomal protein L9